MLASPRPEHDPHGWGKGQTQVPGHKVTTHPGRFPLSIPPELVEPAATSDDGVTSRNKLTHVPTQELLFNPWPSTFGNSCPHFLAKQMPTLLLIP